MDLKTYAVLPSMLGAVFAFLPGLIALRWLSRWLENGSWYIFGIYCFFYGCLVLSSPNWILTSETDRCYDEAGDGILSNLCACFPKLSSWTITLCAWRHVAVTSKNLGTHRIAAEKRFSSEIIDRALEKNMWASILTVR